MKLLTAISKHSQESFQLEDLVLAVSDSIPLSVDLTVSSVSDVSALKPFHGAIFQIADEEELYYSQALVQKQFSRQYIPYLYVIQDSFLFDVDRFQEFFPDQLVLAPVSPEHLRMALRLFLMKIQRGYHITGMEQRDRRKIWLSIRRGVYQSIETDQIKWIEASDHYIKIFTEDGEYVMIKASLREFYEKHLRHFTDFYILNRSMIINTKKVSKIENGQLFIDGDKPLSIPRARRDEVLEVLEVG